MFLLFLLNFKIAVIQSNNFNQNKPGLKQPFEDFK